jgi:protoporphyrin/coproporphyrin ferrochelatase
VATRDPAGLLLVNLGTPRAPTTAAVRAYLREFLSDPRVIDIPGVARWLLLNLAILPFRSPRSAQAYAKIWTERGSPLLANEMDLVEKVRARLGPEVRVELAMRYGEPSVARTLAALDRAGVRRLVVFPLYPQASSAATGSSIEKVAAEASKLWNVPSLAVVPPFFDDRRYVEAFAAAARPCLEEVDPELVFFSFHGLPERQIRKSDRGGNHCLRDADCCERPGDAFGDCYRAQSHVTARLLGDALGVPPARRLVCFQSRLGRTPWIRPFTDVEVRAAAMRGVKRAVIVVPSFVADCLETLEEIGIRAAADWKAHGGEVLRLVPSLNARDDWADAVVAIARDASPWLR